MALRSTVCRLLLSPHRCAFFSASRAQGTAAATRPDAEKSDRRAKPPKVQFDWRDGLDLEGQLTEEEILIRDSFRTYCQEKLMPRIRRLYPTEQLLVDPVTFVQFPKSVALQVEIVGSSAEC